MFEFNTDKGKAATTVTGRTPTQPTIQQVAPAPQLIKKIVLKTKGTSECLKQAVSGAVEIDLAWTAAVDLDLHAFCTMKKDPYVHGAAEREELPDKPGLFNKLKAAVKHDIMGEARETVLGKPKSGKTPRHIGFGRGVNGRLDNKGNTVGLSDPGDETKNGTKEPFIHLSVDAGVGGRTVGEEVETMVIHQPDTLDFMIVAANIYNGRDCRFGDYDGCVRLKAGAETIEVQLNSSQKGSWAVVAGIDFTGLTPRIVVLNEITDKTPELDDYMGSF